MFSLVNRIVNVWTDENRVSSNSAVKQTELPNLEREDAKGLYGKLVEIDGPLSDGMESCGVFQPGRQVTSNCFDKGQIYHSLNSVQEYLTALGIKVPQMLTETDPLTGKSKAFPVRAHANAVSDLNAWYSPQTKDLTFGTYGEMSQGKDMWHLASDNDVTIHEFGHLILDQINPRLSSSWQGDGRAIHEGFADSVAALYADDPEMSEDFAVAMGRAPSKKDGLRIVDNDLTLADVSEEEHDKGQVYAGFFWSIKKALTDPNGPFKMDSRQAADLVLRLLFNHAALYNTSRPTSADCVNAVIRALDTMRVSSIPMFASTDALKSFIMAEAERRKMLKPAGKIDDECIEPSEDAAMKKAGAKAKFVPVKSTPFSGGISEIYQQQYMTSSGVAINVVGGAIHVQKNAAGKTIRVSSKDVRTIKAGEINEQVNLSPAKAASIAAADAHKRLQSAQQWMQSTWNSRPDNFVDTFASFQMDFRVAEAALQTIGDKGAMKKNMKLAVVPGSNDIHYEIPAGMGTYFVNARTGEVSFKKEVFVN